jgi:hypothetical protein
LYAGETRIEKSIRNTMICPEFTHDVEYGLLMFHLSIMPNEKEAISTKEIWAIPTQNSRI